MVALIGWFRAWSPKQWTPPVVVDRTQRLVPTFDGGDDAVWVGGPDKGFRVVVGFVEEAVDGGPQVDEDADNRRLQPFVGVGDHQLDAGEAAPPASLGCPPWNEPLPAARRSLSSSARRAWGHGNSAFGPTRRCGAISGTASVTACEIGSACSLSWASVSQCCKRSQPDWHATV